MTIPAPLRPFRIGLNYWPAQSAMGWWQSFERAEVEADFQRIAAAGFDSLRLFLLWEHFQPKPDQVAANMVDRLVTTLELAKAAGLCVMPTLFTGHMSGVNWVPSWALGGVEGDRRFRVVSKNSVVQAGLCNWYAEPQIARAQAFLARQLARAIAGHEAVWAWDLGNENSNCVVPPTRAHGRDWLKRMSDAIREGDDNALITIGLHMEDLERDRKLGPVEAGEVCDFLTMHGYPGYASWSRGPTDEALLPFLAHITRWLSGGKEIVFSEFGVPSYRAGDRVGEQARTDCTVALVEEELAAAYIERSLTALVECGCTGALLWCHSDYAQATWQSPPLDTAVHERFFGLWRADASAKPAVAAVQAFAKRGTLVHAWTDTSWIDIDPGEFFEPESSVLPHLYHRYCQARGAGTEH